MVFSSQIFLFVFFPLSILGAYLIHPDFRKYFLILVSLAFLPGRGQTCWRYFSFLRLRTTPWVCCRVVCGIITDLQRKLLIGRLFLPTWRSWSLSSICPSSLISWSASPEWKSQRLTSRSLWGFFVFSAISYQYDIYYNKIAPQKNIADFLLYMSFFPKLLQGPITRAGDFTAQLAHNKLDLDSLSKGVYRFTVGLAKKVIIADQLGAMVDQIFANPANANGVSIAWLGAFGYAMQIFFDFSGYTDMAIGLGQMLGFDLPENFNFPILPSIFPIFGGAGILRWAVGSVIMFFIRLNSNAGSKRSFAQNPTHWSFSF